MRPLIEKAEAIVKSIVESPGKIELVSKSWTDTFAGHVAFEFEGHLLVFFNDCSDLDYLDFIRFSNGRYAGFLDLIREGEEEGRYPLSCLSSEEHKILDSALRNAPRSEHHENRMWNIKSEDDSRLQTERWKKRL